MTSPTAPFWRTVAALTVMMIFQSCSSQEHLVRGNDHIPRADALSISVVFQRHYGRPLPPRVVRTEGEDAHFHVILENVSNKPLKLWQGYAYGGYESLSFRLIDRNGSVFQVRRRPLPLGTEVDNSMILSPKERTVIDVYPARIDANSSSALPGEFSATPAGEEWIGFPRGEETPQSFSLQAIYTSKMPKRESIGWTGEVVSPVYNIEWLK